MLVVTSFASTVQAQSSSGYHLLKKFVLGGEGGWDLLTFDSAAHRLYISRSTHVMVVDADSGAIVGDIPNTPRVHGIAIAPEFGKGFTSNGGDASVTIFDLKTLKTLGQVKVGQNPDAIIYDPASKRIFTFNGGSKDTTAIDAKSGTVAGTLALGGRPELGVADEHGKIFVNLEDKTQVVAFDSRKLTVDATWPLAPGEEPTGIAMDRKHRRLFVVCANKLMAVINADNGKLVTTLPIGSGVDGAGFDAERQLAFSSNGDGTLTVVHEDSPDKFSVAENVVTQRGARTLDVDQKAHRVFLITADFGPPPPATAERPHPRPSIVPGTVTLLVFGK
ncbi:MAG TPA: YVTN family beta-propeller domain-containing protein [Blastocatellia bacterium]|nr:YVTN family beta-propeller domain-containing protein [Blastocatellia bacterium]HAF24395.1 YVTN family beta-propeller domain-containing protein [Blastocatellia bacterium]HCX29459.1 YVTN family beta-propeller domain-containing protein [Blastocatellia bacterium]